MERWVILLEFRADKGEEVVSVQKCLGPLCEVLLVIGQAVVTHSFARVEEHVVVQFLSFRFLKSSDDTRFFERENLVVESVGEFVEDDGGVFQELAA